MDCTKPRLILYSGLGVDERLIGPQRAIAGADVEIPKWIDPLPEDTLATYSRRMAEQLIVDDRPIYVGGVSFGGMVAQEVARHVPAKGLVLIATCLSSRGLPLPYRWASRFARHLPLWVLNLGKPILPRVRVLMGITKSREVEWFSDMIADTEASFLRWCLGAIADWDGTGPTTLPFVHVHGQHDLVIPPAWGNPTHLIPHAGHVCNVTHPAEVNAVIETFLAAQAPPSPVRETPPAVAGIGSGL